MPAEAYEFTMPSLGADMDEGKLVEWLVRPGDKVDKGDIVAVVETAKATMEVECFRDGVVDRLLVEPGTTVPVGEPLARLTTEAAPAEAPSAEAPAAPGTGPKARAEAGPTAGPEAAEAGPPAVPPAGPLIRKLAAELGVDLATVQPTGRQGKITREDVRRAASRPSPEPSPPPPAPPPAPAPPAPAPPPGVRISPYARKLAEQLGVDLATVRGSGRGGAIRADDVRAAAAAEQPEQPPAEEAPARRPEAAEEAKVAEEADATARRAEAARQTTARLMARSKREIPHYYLRTTVDVTDMLAWLRERNRELPVSERILPAAVFLKATADAADAVPRLNGFWKDDHFEPGPAVNLGVPVSLRGGGLITPAIADAETLDTAALGSRMRDLATRAKAGRLRGSEMSGATITVTNLGDLGVELVYGVIYPPQVAIVGVGRIVERPWAVNGLLGVRSVAAITLSGDHRATDGATGARFLEAMSRTLSNPENL